jgi:multiple sugar transport system permease protein
MLQKYKRFYTNKSYKNPQVLRKILANFVIKILRLMFLIGLCYIFLFPLIYMVTVALQSPDAVNDPSVVWIPKALTLTSIKDAMAALNYKNSIILSTVISVLSTIATLVSCSLVGYGFSRFNFRFKNIQFFMVILTIIVPPQTLLISSYLNFRFFDFGGLLKILSPIISVSNINLLNTPWTYVLPAIFANGLRAGLFIFIFRQFFIGMPKDLEEAAKIDGCGALKTYVRIIVPLAIPAFITVLLFSFVWHWNDLYGAIMYFNEGVRPITAMLFNMSALLAMSKNMTLDYMSAFQLRTYLAAGAFMTILPPLIIYIFTQKYFTESIERTGMVG